MEPIHYILIAALAIAALAVLVARYFYRQTHELLRQNRVLSWQSPIRKTAEQQQDERLERQLEAVMRERVTFRKSRIMGRGEFELFRAAMGVTRQPFPTGAFPFYVFPQVSLGQIIRTAAPDNWHADQAHRAINSKRCDLLIADRNGNPVAVLEYQGSGHDIGGTAGWRDSIKRIALERAGVRYVEIKDGTSPADLQHTIRSLLTPAASTPATIKGR